VHNLFVHISCMREEYLVLFYNFYNNFFVKSGHKIYVLHIAVMPTIVQTLIWIADRV